MRNLTGASLGAVSRSIIPFFLVMAAFALMITLYPQIVLWRPELV